MSNNFSYRIIFSKADTAVYISHLDVMRTFTRAFRRAKTPIYYTEGYTKRPLLVFPYPLSLGIGGEKEILDIKTTVEIPDVNDFMTRLNAVLANGIRVNEIISSEFPPVNYAIYEIISSAIISDVMVNDFLKQDSIQATKFSKKKGDIVFDLKPYIKMIELVPNENIKVILPVGELSNVNVNVFIKAFSDFVGFDSNGFYAKRTGFLP
ncbi:MAG: TIGR03936 family radical SAM-associated protein [Ruminococcus sp.]|jgi:radical SAM-linked protein|nr:TIGR03936 family radical SAM-associated protein [Ruminococcus sp.]